MATKPKPTKFRYIVELVVETDAKVTKKAVRAFVEDMLNPNVIILSSEAREIDMLDVQTRVRKIDMD